MKTCNLLKKWESAVRGWHARRGDSYYLFAPTWSGEDHHSCTIKVISIMSDGGSMELDVFVGTQSEAGENLRGFGSYRLVYVLPVRETETVIGEVSNETIGKICEMFESEAREAVKKFSRTHDLELFEDTEDLLVAILADAMWSESGLWEDDGDVLDD